LIALTVPEVRRLLLALDEPPERFSLRLAWSRWRRHHQAVAKRGHAARRARRPAPTPAAIAAIRAAPVPLLGWDDAGGAAVAALTPSQWQRIAPLLPTPRRRHGQPPCDLRPMIEAMLWIERAGCSWRALPSHFGPWRDVYARYHRWRQDGLWLRIRQALDQCSSEVACA
jgi:Putative transposase of IS4/5 family (DUF4096)